MRLLSRFPSRGSSAALRSNERSPSYSRSYKYHPVAVGERGRMASKRPLPPSTAPRGYLIFRRLLAISPCRGERSSCLTASNCSRHPGDFWGLSSASAGRAAAKRVKRGLHRLLPPPSPPTQPRWEMKPRTGGRFWPQNGVHHLLGSSCRRIPPASSNVLLSSPRCLHGLCGEGPAQHGDPKSNPSGARTPHLARPHPGFTAFAF